MRDCLESTNTLLESEKQKNNRYVNNILVLIENRFIVTSSLTLTGFPGFSKFVCWWGLWLGRIYIFGFIKFYPNRQ